MSEQVSASYLYERLIDKSRFAPCEQAFIDTRIPGSEGKRNYCFIGSGVSQNAEQVVNMEEPHGFQIGGVGLPHGHVNNLHLHFTAEVFICARGEWTLFWGADGSEGECVLREGDIVSIPTWIFRGFKNTGPDDGFMFTVLGGDDTGGIIWGPQVLRRAAETGLYLTRDNLLIDTNAGQIIPPQDQLLQPVSESDLGELVHYTPAQMAGQLVRCDERHWSGQAFLASVLPGAAIELAPVHGYGISEDRNTQAKMTKPHGFSLDWLRGQAGECLPTHRLGIKQVLINQQGRWRLRLDSSGGPVEIVLEEWGIYSIPAGIWRSFEALDEGVNEMLVVCAGDVRKRIEWTPYMISQARDNGWTYDANGYIAKTHLLPKAS